MGKKINIHLLLMVPVVAVLATGTVLEKFNGHDWTAAHIYGAWWFIALWALLATAGIVYFIKRKVIYTVFYRSHYVYKLRI